MDSFKISFYRLAMKQKGFDSILLLALVIPFIMTYRLSWGETPYWWFGTIFALLGGYFTLDLLSMAERMYYLLKKVTLWVVILGVIGSAFISAMIVRHQTHPIYGIHDMPLQQEIAIRFLLEGVNPYAVTYFGTFLEQWHYSETATNPALYHFVLPPFYIISAVPFYFMSNFLFGFFDARIPLLIFFAVLLVFADRLVKDQEKKRLFLILLAFNPALLGYTLEGRSDMYMFAFLFLALFLLYKKKMFFAGISMGIAFATKQSAWLIFPFYIAYLYFQEKDIRLVTKLCAPFLISFLIIIAPFFLWDPKAFLDSTIFYLSGATSNSYPISGYGLGKLLNQLGLIKDMYQYYPFYIWQILIGLPVLIALIKFLKKTPSVRSLIFVYGIFLFIFWYLSRYFNNSHIAYLSMVFITAYFWPEKDD